MKNKLYKPIILSLMALSLVGCDTNDVAIADKDESTNIVEETNDEEMNTENKPAEDNIDKTKLKDNEEDRGEEVKEDNKEGSSESNKNSKEVAEKAPSGENTEEDKNLHEKDGKYVTSMIAELKGEADDYITSTAYDYKIEDDKFIVSGSFDYHEDPEDFENFEEIKNEKEQKFTINDETVFQAVGGMAPAKDFGREDFLKYLDECKNSGLALIIFVEDGIAKTVQISS